MKYTNGLDFKPILEPYYEVTQKEGVYTICVVLTKEEFNSCVDVSQLVIKIAKNEVFLEDKAVYLYLEGISDKVFNAIINKKSILSIVYE